MITEIWAEAHYRDAHIQTTDWTDYQPSFWLLNGRSYPDTLEASGNPLDDHRPAGRLQYQPISSLIRCNSGGAGAAAAVQPRLPEPRDDRRPHRPQVVAKDASVLGAGRHRRTT